ncbi:MAG TPA: hypothetical protein VF292_02540 [Rhodanobacteraceae bacterium]
MWPLITHPDHITRWIFTTMLWAPSAIWIALFYKTHRADSNEIFAATLASWVLLQYIAIGYARSHGMHSLPPRYVEITAIGVAANAWLALKLVTRRGALRWSRFGVCAGALLVAWVFWRRTPNDLASMQQRHIFTSFATYNVRRYLTHPALPLLPIGSPAIPCPTSGCLRHSLKNAQIRDMLAPSIMPRARRRNNAALSNIAVSVQKWVRNRFPTSTWAAGTLSTFRLLHFDTTTVARNGECSLDIINGRPSVDALPLPVDGVATFEGWMGNGRRQAVVNGIFILKGATESYSAEFRTGVVRADVAAALQSAAMLRSGYNLTTALSGIAAGTYSLFAIDANHHPSTLCNFHRTLTVD